MLHFTLIELISTHVCDTFAFMSYIFSTDLLEQVGCASGAQFPELRSQVVSINVISVSKVNPGLQV